MVVAAEAWIEDLLRIWVPRGSVDANWKHWTKDDDPLATVATVRIHALIANRILVLYCLWEERCTVGPIISMKVCFGLLGWYRRWRTTLLRHQLLHQQQHKAPSWINPVLEQWKILFSRKRYWILCVGREGLFLRDTMLQHLHLHLRVHGRVVFFVRGEHSYNFRMLKDRR